VIIAFDFDDVLIDFVGCFLKAVNTRFDLDMTRDDIETVDWDMQEWANRLLSRVTGRYFAGRCWLEWLTAPGNIHFWEEADTVPGALEALRFLDEAGHKLEIVTNKSPEAAHVVWKWLHDNRAPIYAVHILQGFSKAEASQAEILVDDRPATIREWNASRPDRLGILFARSQNKEDRDDLYVANDFADIVYATWRKERMKCLTAV
jgi:phosphoglycolate phosphatase-like HAD superfamily hydrolase